MAAFDARAELKNTSPPACAVSCPQRLASGCCPFSWLHAAALHKGRVPQNQGPCLLPTFTSFTKATKHFSTRLAEVLLRIALKCSGLIPEGPAAEPFLKERAADSTSLPLNARGAQVSAGGGGWGAAGAGCFDFSDFNLAIDSQPLGRS